MLHTYREVHNFRRMMEHEKPIETAKKHLKGRDYASQQDTERASLQKS